MPSGHPHLRDAGGAGLSGEDSIAVGFGRGLDFMARDWYDKSVWMTPVTKAFLHNRRDAAQLLLELGADRRIADPLWEKTLAHRGDSEPTGTCS